MKRTIQDAAFDRGATARSEARIKTNPYDRKTSPSLWESWERGWKRADQELSR